MIKELFQITGERMNYSIIFIGTIGSPSRKKMCKPHFITVCFKRLNYLHVNNEKQKYWKKLWNNSYIYPEQEKLSNHDKKSKSLLKGE